jgi:hypothetical protein
MPDGAARAASGYDMSDLWWNPTESGWGISLVQQRDIVQATLFVYDASGAPTWYSATLAFLGLTPQTHALNYAGDLYRTTGPAFAGATFDPAQVKYEKVGALAIVAPSLSRGTLTYNVGPVTVTKSIERATFRFDDYNGTFEGVLRLTASKCANPADDVSTTYSGTSRIVHAGTAMTIAMTTPATTCNFTGVYGQDGRLGHFTSTYACTNGDAGALTFDEMNIQRFGLLARTFGANAKGCRLEGNFAAIEP